MNYHKIDKCSISNGIGFRTVLWVSGCSHHCDGCHNPETWDGDSGQIFDETAKQELFNNLEHEYISGVTFSGGDPLADENAETVYRLVREIREKFPDKSIWLYTGFRLEEIAIDTKNSIEEYRFRAAANADVLVDGKFEADKKNLSLPFRGSSNQRLINMRDWMGGVKDILLYEA